MKRIPNKSTTRWHQLNLLWVLAFLFFLPLGRVKSQTFCLTQPGFNAVGNPAFLGGMNETGPFYLRIYVHIIRRSDGTGGQTEAQVREALGYLDRDFASHNIFFVWDCEIDFIDSDQLFNSSGTSSVFSTNANPDGIDIYLFRDQNPGESGGNGLAAGYGAKSFYVFGNYWEPPFGSLTRSHVISHEMGHCLGLYHTHDTPVCQEFVNGTNCSDCGDYVCDTPADPCICFNIEHPACEWEFSFNDPNGQPYQPDPYLIMAYTHPDCMDIFTQGQGQRMRNIIATLPLLQPTRITNAPAGTVTDITTNTTFSTPMDMPGDIVVHNGFQLTITTTIGIPWQKRIVVERNARLIVDGGTLQPACGAPDWAGINVWGNTAKEQPASPYAALTDATQCGFVVVKNNSRIEQARNAISTTAPGVSWPAAADHYGGLVVCENSDFVNCRRGAEFMRYPDPSANLGFVNKSKFTNCRFEEETSLLSGSSEGVTIWDTDGIRFEQCRFFNMDNDGIVTYDAGVTVVNDNQFVSNRRGVLNTATYPFAYFVQIGEYGSTPNYFEGNQIHVDAFASNKQGGIRVYNNQFFGGNTGVWLEGPTDFRVNDNSFDGQSLGVVAYSTGVQNLFLQNYVNCNDFKDEYGVVFAGENRRTQFLTNNFSNSDTDVYVSEGNEAGAIRSSQGAFNKPAANCFTSPTQNADIFTDGSTLSFRYYYRLESACDENPNTPGNYTKSSANGFIGLCDQGEGGFETPPTKDDLIAKRQQVATLTAQSQASPNDVGIEQSLLAAQGEKEAILKYLIGAALNSNNHTGAEQLLAEENTPAANQALYGLKLNRGAYTDAQVLLNAMPSATQDDIWFKQVQEVNLSRMQAGADYALSEAQKSLLNTVANSGSPVRGYAQGLLTLMTGQRFEREIPVSSRSKRGVEIPAAAKDALMSITPNPARGRFTVAFRQPVMEGTQIRVADFYGRIVYQQGIGNRAAVEVDAAQFSDGIYIVTVYQPGGQIHQQKVVIAR